MVRGFLAAVLAPALVFLAACSANGEKTPDLPGTGILVEGIIIQNALNYAVKDVMVLVPATGGFAGCGNIIPRSECRTSFPSVDYRRNALKVTWTEHGEPKGTDEFVVEPPPGVASGDSVWLEVVVYSPGLAGARLVQP